MIKYENQVFSLETEDTGYYIGLRSGLIEKFHYGNKIVPDFKALSVKIDSGYGTDVIYNQDLGASIFHLNLELAPSYKGDFRNNPIELIFPDGSKLCDWTYKDYEILDGDVGIRGLPSAYGANQSLILKFETSKGLELELVYSIFEGANVITKFFRLKNNLKDTVKIEKFMSYQLDLDEDEYYLSSFTGAWARERWETIRKVVEGENLISSTTGNSSHYANPFFMIYQEGASEDFGRVYGFNLIYSGNHQAVVERSPYNKVRVSAGINSQTFSWDLGAGEIFESPQAVITFSDKGKNGMSQNLHNFVKNNIVRGFWAKKERPVLINNWEATYFKFKERDLLDLARQAKKVGIELFVLDDGWFGRRDSDKRGLGDYEVNRKKIPSGLSGLAEKINSMGMDFGLWIEPEMVNYDSELYEKHPDWIVKDPTVEASLSRNQLVLDLCRKEVQDYIIGSVNKLLKSANISYIKWDMNRHISDAYSGTLKNQGEFYHRYILGLYRVLGAITQENPKVLFEACASGGNRFDLGILSYMPQIWTSDNTDFYERSLIQTGTSYGYPQSVMACHVSDSPNHQTLRTSPLESRFDISAMGILGYELDLSDLSKTDRETLRLQIAYYKEHRRLLQFGKFYRVQSPFKSREKFSWIIVSDDGHRAILLNGQGRMQANQEASPLRFKGLKPDGLYKVKVRRESFDVRQFGSLINTVSPIRLNHKGLLMHMIATRYGQQTEEEEYIAYGNLLLESGIRLKQVFSGTGYSENTRFMPDYGARLYFVETYYEKSI